MLGWLCVQEVAIPAIASPLAVADVEGEEGHTLAPTRPLTVAGRVVAPQGEAVAAALAEAPVPPPASGWSCAVVRTKDVAAVRYAVQPAVEPLAPRRLEARPARLCMA